MLKNVRGFVCNFFPHNKGVLSTFFSCELKMEKSDIISVSAKTLHISDNILGKFTEELTKACHGHSLVNAAHLHLALVLRPQHFSNHQAVCSPNCFNNSVHPKARTTQTQFLPHLCDL